MRIAAAKTVRRAYTLLEVLLVMAVMVLLVAIAFPTVDAMYGNVRMTAAVDQVRGQWGEGRARAIDQGVSYRFAVMVGQSKFRMAPDLPEFWSGGDASALLEGDTLVIEDNLPKGVTFSNGNTNGGSGDWQTVVVFTPLGECKEDGEIIVRSEGFRPILIKIRGLTAVTTVTTLDREMR